MQLQRLGGHRCDGGKQREAEAREDCGVGMHKRGCTVCCWIVLDRLRMYSNFETAAVDDVGGLLRGMWRCVVQRSKRVVCIVWWCIVWCACRTGWCSRRLSRHH